MPLSHDAQVGRADVARPPRERDLTRRLGGLVADAQRILDTDIVRTDVAAPTVETAGEMLAVVARSALDELRAAKRGQARVQELCDLSVRAADLDGDVREHGIQRRTRALAGVEAALGRLRCMSTSGELVDNVCQELVRSCGFNRALLSRVEDKTWIPWVVHFGHRDTRESDAEWIANRRIPLSKMTLERELIEDRQAAYIVDATGDDRADQQFVEDTSATSYVASPIIPEGRVVGFLHADYYPTGRAVDRVDRDILWAFAEGFGRLYERTVLLERLNAQRDHVRQTLRNAEVLMDRLAHGELELARGEEERSMISGVTAVTLAGERSALDELLTPREREVLALIVVGQSNSAIAARLVISEGTVKSHVKQILRKIGAANRSEAIARYLGMISSS